MKNPIVELSLAWQFLSTGLRRFEQTASLVPSSRFLASAMLRGAALDRARCVVELGPGVGTVTQAILAQMPENAHLHVIELDRRLLETTVRNTNDARVRPIHASAADTAMLVRHDGCLLGADAVISSLGLSMMPTALRETILGSVTDELAPGGVFVQYQYLFSRILSRQANEGWHGFDGQAFLGKYFRDVTSTVVWPNLPPAAVYTCRGARALRQPVKAASGIR